MPSATVKQLIGRRAVGLQGGSGSRAPPSWAFLSPPLAELVFALTPGGQGGRSGKLPDSSLAGARPDPDGDCNPPPHAADKLQASRARAGGSPPYCTSHGLRAAWRQGACMQRCFPPSQIRVGCLARSWIHAAKCL
jgi:hypothetical protein